VVANGIPLLAKATEARQQEISRIVSEAYFHLGDYPKALAYMDNYAKLGGEMGREELYLAGYCNYVDRDYPKAIDRLTQVASGGDELAQNASFHLGDAYLQMGDRKSDERFRAGRFGRFRPGDPRRGHVQLRKVAVRIGRRYFQRSDHHVG